MSSNVPSTTDSSAASRCPATASFIRYPLEYDGKEAINHGYAGRAPWFGCACCPPNVLRTMASLGGYAYGVRDENLYVNLYAQSDVHAEIKGIAVKISQKTNYPWDGAIKLTVEPDAPAAITLALRIPGWVNGHPLPGDLYTYDDPSPSAWSIKVNGREIKPELNRGYAMIARDWKPGDVVELNLPMPVRRVAANPRVAADRGLVALERGPVVYAFEGLDNDGSVFDIELPDSATITSAFKPDLLDGVSVLTVSGANRISRGAHGKLSRKVISAVAIPYASWNNRGLSPMSVWLGRDAGHVRPFVEPAMTSTAKVSVSFARGGMDPGRINDRQMPRNATDGFAPNFDFWPHKGGSEWISYDFGKPIRVEGVTVSWFDDTGSGECRLPRAWKVLYQDEAGQWRPVNGASPYAVQKATPVTVTFNPVTTQALRIELDLQENFSAGLYEWEVDSGK